MMVLPLPDVGVTRRRNSRLALDGFCQQGPPSPESDEGYVRDVEINGTIGMDRGLQKEG
jgi:hypothetical protein